MSPPETKAIMLPSGDKAGSEKLGLAAGEASAASGGAGWPAAAKAPPVAQSETEQASPINMLVRNSPSRPKPDAGGYSGSTWR
jgi:hypothetical protein